MLSNEEKIVYEYIQENITDKIQYIGREKHKIFNYLNKNERYQPDFVIENLLDKPIILEHFGCYHKTKARKMIAEYTEKRLIKKIEFFESRDDIYFIATFPEDTKI